MRRTLTLLLTTIASTSLVACSSNSTTKTDVQVESTSQRAENTRLNEPLTLASSTPSVALPNPSNSVTPESILHVDNVKKVPVASSQEDFYEIEDAVGITNDDERALSMIQKGKLLMVVNDSPITVLESFGYLTKIKVKKTGHTGWVKSSWIQPELECSALDQALLHSARDGQIEEVKSLLERGADINAQDAELGMTALMYAADGGHVEVVRLLISGGSNLNIKDKFGSTALSGLDGRVNEQQRTILRILKRAGAK
jgi:ankyrin repeat protein